MAASMSVHKIRIIANACITRFDGGERTIEDIINSYTALNDEDKTLVIAEIASKRLDIEIEGSA